MSKLILFMGNSVTDCGRNREDNSSLGNGYACFMAANLGATAPGEYSFINRGIGGNRVADIVSRMDEDIIALKPDYMSILTGANDVSTDYMNRTVDTERYEAIYSLLIKETLKRLPALKIMILTPFLLPHKQLEKTYEKFSFFSTEGIMDVMTAYADSTVKVAKEYSLPYVNLHEKFGEALKHAPAEYWTKDGYHPTPMGHGLITREWLKLFEEMK